MADEIILVLEIEGVGNDLVVIHVSKLLCNILELGDGWDIGWINRGDGEREGGRKQNSVYNIFLRCLQI